MKLVFGVESPAEEKVPICTRKWGQSLCMCGHRLRTDHLRFTPDSISVFSVIRGSFAGSSNILGVFSFKSYSKSIGPALDRYINAWRRVVSRGNQAKSNLWQAGPKFPKANSSSAVTSHHKDCLTKAESQFFLQKDKKKKNVSNYPKSIQ